MGAGWDEIVDIDIAASYVASPFSGSLDDPTQARLPMYFVYMGTSVLPGDMLWIARLMSVLLGIGCLLGTYACARELDARAAGLLACVLLAVNPFFLAFSRVALTESGIYEATLGIWWCYFMLRLRNLTVSSIIWFGIMSGLLVSTKFTGIALLPLAVVALFRAKENGAERRVDSNPKPALTAFGIAALTAIPILWLILVARQPGLAKATSTGVDISAVLALYTICMAVYLGCLALLISRRTALLSFPLATIVFLAVTISTVLLFPPPHFINTGILGSFLERMFDRSPMDIPLIMDKTVFLMMCLLLKPGPVLGSILLFSPFVVLALKKMNLQSALLVATVCLWFVAAVMTDWLQVFYCMPLLPVLTVLAASCLCKLLQMSRRTALAILVVCLMATGIDLGRSFPDFNLNGFQWIGPRAVFGFTPLGYVAVGTVGYDGVFQALKYVDSRINYGETVVTYFPNQMPHHLVRHVAGDSDFTLIDGKNPARKNAYENADYVISTIETETLAKLDIDSYPRLFKSRQYSLYDPVVLDQRFERVFTVDRAFGLTIASVWKRKKRASLD